MKWRRFRKKTYAFYERPVDLSTILIMVAGLAIWLVWPLGAKRTERHRAPTGMRIDYVGGVVSGARMYREPTKFVSPVVTGFDLPSEGFTAILQTTRRTRARLLPRAKGQTETDRGGAPPSLAARAKRDLTEYAPRWRQAPVFLRAEGRDERLVTRLCPELARAEFRIPELSGLKITNGKAWQVGLYVDCGEDGKVRDVFVEQGSGDPLVDGALVRAMYRAEAGAGVTGAAGRVTLSYGRQ